MLRKFQVSPFYRLGDMEKTSLLQEVVLNYYRISTGRPRRSYKKQYDGEMGQKVRYSLGKVYIGPPTPTHQQEDNPSAKWIKKKSSQEDVTESLAAQQHQLNSNMHVSPTTIR